MEKKIYFTILFLLISLGFGLQPEDSTAGYIGNEKNEPQTVLVTPIQWERFNSGKPTDEMSTHWEQILLNANRYALTTWYSNTIQSETGYYYDLGVPYRLSSIMVRSEALALAISLKTGGYDENLIGIPSSTAQAITLKLIRSAAHVHEANQSPGWGMTWDSASVSADLGLAAWIMWEDLNQLYQVEIQHMIEMEADRLLYFPPFYYQDRYGTILYPGDTRAEDDAWNIKILALAAAMMPGHPHKAAWVYKSIELSIAATARPADLIDSSLANGRPVSDWFKGTNYNDDGTTINHNIFPHLNYMLQGALNRMPGILTNILADTAIPESYFANTNIIYAAYSSLDFPSPPFSPPGGTIFIPGSYLIHDPSGGVDVGMQRYYSFGSLDVFVTSFGKDQLAPPGLHGDYWEALHANQVLVMQGRFDDGRMFAPGEDTQGSEELSAQISALTYLTRWLLHQTQPVISNKSYPCVNHVCAVNDTYLIPAGYTKELKVLKNDILFDQSVNITAITTSAFASISFTLTNNSLWVSIPEKTLLNETLTYTIGNTNNIPSSSEVKIQSYEPRRLLWLNAFDLANLDDQSKISHWPDRSGLHHNADQEAPAAMPVFRAELNGRPAVEFHNNQFLTVGDLENISTDYSILFVGQIPRSNINSRNSIFSLNNSTFLFFGGTPVANLFGYNATNPSQVANASSTMTANQWEVVYLIKNGAEITLGNYRDGLATKMDLLYEHPLSKFVIGARQTWSNTTNQYTFNYFEGAISEVVVYNYALPNSELQRALSDLYNPPGPVAVKLTKFMAYPGRASHIDDWLGIWRLITAVGK